MTGPPTRRIRRARAIAERDETPAIGLLNWGNVIEDFLHPSGLTLERYRDEFTGSWIFGWAQALACAGVRAHIVCISRDARATVRTVHRPTGATLIVLPTTRAYRAIERRMTYPYGLSAAQVFGWTSPPDLPRRALGEVVREVAPYLTTPPVRLARTARRERWQAVVCQEYEYPRFDLCVALGRTLRTPVFACFQGGRQQHGRLERLTRPPAIAHCAGLVVGSGQEAARVRARYGVAPERIARIGNPVDTRVWRPRDAGAARRELGIPADARVVAWHGRVAMHHKGLDVLLDAWKMVADGHGDVRLLLVGSGQDSAELDRRIADDRLQGIVRVDRYVHDPEELSRCLSAADVYAFASRHEGFAVAPLEAMACGLPIVATDVAGVRDLLPGGAQSGGIVVRSEDPAALAAGLTQLLDDESLRRDFGGRARATVQQEFSLEAVGARLRTVLCGDEGR
jgi:glycosyltransferase involved in cell wall biosynthesis